MGAFSDSISSSPRVSLGELARVRAGGIFIIALTVLHAVGRVFVLLTPLLMTNTHALARVQALDPFAFRNSSNSPDSCL